jgi:hypothetical protein
MLGQLDKSKKGYMMFLGGPFKNMVSSQAMTADERIRASS